MHVVSGDHVNRARNSDEAARTCEWFVYSKVKITKMHDYQTRTTYLYEKFTTLYVGFFPLDCAFWVLVEWRRQTLVTNPDVSGMLCETSTYLL